MFLIVASCFYMTKIYLCREKKDVSEILNEFSKFNEIWINIRYEELPLEQLGEGHMLFIHKPTHDNVGTVLEENTISEKDIEKILDYRRSYYAFWGGRGGPFFYDDLEKYRGYKFRIFREEIIKETGSISDGYYFVVIEKTFESLDELKEEKKKNVKFYEYYPYYHDILLNHIPHESVYLIPSRKIMEIRKLKEIQEPSFDSEETLERKKMSTILETEKGLIIVDGNKVLFRGRFTSKDIESWLNEINNNIPEWSPSKEDVFKAYKCVLGIDVSDLVSEVFIVPRVVKDGQVLPGKVIIIPKDESQAGLLIGKQGRIAKKVSEILDGYYIKIKTSRDELRKKLNKLAENLLFPGGERNE